MKIEVGAFGYIQSKKKWYMSRVLLYAAIAIAIFIFGLCVNKFNRANIFTILAVLMVLPAAKAMVAYILFAKYHSVSKDRYEAVYDALASNLDSVHPLCEVMQTTSVIDQKVTLFTDVVFTSNDKVMNLDFVLMTKRGLYALVGKSGQDTKYLLSYLKEIMKQHNYFGEIKVTEKEEKFLSYAKAVGVNGISDDDLNVKVVQTMQIYIVK